MRHVLLKTGAALALAVTWPLAAAHSDPSADLFVSVEHPGAPEDLGVKGFPADHGLFAEPSAPQIPTGQDVEIQELQEAFPSTNWPPSMRK